MAILTVVDIDEKLFDAAYTLIRTIAPEVSAEQWSDYACKVTLRGGLLGLLGPDGTLFGIMTYRVEQSLRRGQCLLIDNFVTLELNRAAPGRRALSDAAEALAREEGCTSIEVRLDSRGYVDHSTIKAQGWFSLGHSLDAVVFVKSLINSVDADSPADIPSLADASAATYKPGMAMPL